MTRSTTEVTAPARPVLCRLAEVLAAQTETPTAPTEAPTASSDAPPSGPAGSGTGVADPESASLHRIDATAPAMADRVLRAVVEILCGRRAAEQLATVLRPDQLRYLIGLRGAARRLRPHIQSVHSQQPAPGVLEATAVIVLRTGVRALSARFEVHIAGGGARWQCTALHLPLTRGDVTTARSLR